jgi:tetratricopeptide (TPR) repeat protein
MPTDLAKDLNDRLARAVKLHNAGKREEAVRIVDGMVGVAKAHLGERHPIVEQTLRHSSDFQESAGNMFEAERLQREALSIRRFLVGERDLSLVPSLLKLAAINLAMDRHKLAEPLVREAIDICGSVGEKHDGLVALPLRTLAQVQIADRRPDDALESIKRAIEASEGFQEPKTRKDFLAQALVIEASACVKLGQYEEAQRLLREAVGLYRELSGAGSADVISTTLELASAHEQLGDLEQADALVVQCAEVLRSVVGEFKGAFIGLLERLARLRAGQGFVEDARRLLDVCERLLAVAPGADRVAQALEAPALAVIDLATGHFAGAASRLERALDVLKSNGRAFVPTASMLLARRANLLEALGDNDRAVACAQEAVQLARTSERNSDVVMDMSLAALAGSLQTADKLEEAEATARELIALRRRSKLSDPVGVALGLDVLADALEAQHRNEESIAAARDGLDALASALHELHPASEPFHRNLAWVLARLGNWTQAAVHAAWGMERRLERTVVWLGDDRERGLALALNEYRVCLAIAIALRDPAQLWLGLSAALRLWPLWPAVIGASRLQSLSSHGPEHEAKVSLLRRLDAQIEELEEDDTIREGPWVGKRWNELNQERVRVADELRAAAAEHVWTEAGARCGPESYVSALDRTSVLLAFIRYDPPNFGRKQRSDPSFEPARYARLLLAKGASELRDLGDCAEIDRLIMAGAENASALGDRLFGLPAGTRPEMLYVAPTGSLAELDITAIAGGATGLPRGAVRLVTSPWGVLGLAPPLSAGAADRPLVVASPQLDAAADSPPADAIAAPPSNGWLRRNLERVGLVSPPRPVGAQVRLERPSSWCEPAPMALKKDRDACRGPSGPREPIGGVDQLAGAGASTGAVLARKSPLWLLLAGPWGVLPDEWPDPSKRSLEVIFSGVPPPGVDDPHWPINPLLRAGFYLHSGAARRVLARGPILTARLICGMDLSQTAAVVIATPPRLPKRGPVGQARLALVRAFHWAGARCVVIPRTNAQTERSEQAAAGVVDQLRAGVLSSGRIAAWVAANAGDVLDAYEQT